MELSRSSICLLNDIRLTAFELQRLFAPSPNRSNAVEFDSFTDLDPYLSSISVVPSTTGGDRLSHSASNELSHCVNHKECDLRIVESVTEYSMIQSLLNVIEETTNNAAHFASICQLLITALKKMLESSNVEGLSDIIEDCQRMCEENPFLHTQNSSTTCPPVNNEIKSPGKPKLSDLNRTDIFEVVEKLCDQTEYDTETLEAELRNTRYDLEQAQESLDVSRKTVSYIKSQLESEKERSAYLEASSSKIIAIVRDIAAEFHCCKLAEDNSQTALSLKRQMLELLAAFPWLRSWKTMEQLIDKSYGENNPYLILQQKNNVLQEKTRALQATTSFIDDLSIELKDVKAERARLREELESRNRLIQKLEEDGTKKSMHIDKYREAFDALFEPNTAANFAKQVAEQYKQFKNKSLLQSASCDTRSTESDRYGSSSVEQSTSCQKLRVDTTANPISSHDKENDSDITGFKRSHALSLNSEPDVYLQSNNVHVFKKPLPTSSMMMDSKRIRLTEGPAAALPSYRANADRGNLTPLQTERPHPNHLDQQNTKPCSSAAKPPFPPRSPFSIEKHDPGCPTS